MISLGFKRKELSDGYYGCAPCCESDPKKKDDYENEIVHPEVDFRGKAAEAMNIDELELGEKIRVTLLLEVKGLRSDDRLVDGKKQRDLNLCFKVLEADDYEVVGGDEDESETEAAPSGDTSPLQAAMEAGD